MKRGLDSGIAQSQLAGFPKPPRHLFYSVNLDCPFPLLSPGGASPQDLSTDRACHGVRRLDKCRTLFPSLGAWLASFH